MPTTLGLFRARRGSLAQLTGLVGRCLVRAGLPAARQSIAAVPQPPRFAYGRMVRPGLYTTQRSVVTSGGRRSIELPPRALRRARFCTNA